MRDLYIKNGQGFVVVYSLTNHQTFQDIKTMKELITRVKGTERVPILLVANKVDLEHQREVSEHLTQLVEWYFFFPMREESKCSQVSLRVALQVQELILVVWFALRLSSRFLATFLFISVDLRKKTKGFACFEKKYLHLFMVYLRGFLTFRLFLSFFVYVIHFGEMVVVIWTRLVSFRNCFLHPGFWSMFLRFRGEKSPFDSGSTRSTLLP